MTIFLITIIFASIITPWFTNNRGIILDREKEFNFQRDAEILVISKIAADISNVSTNGYNLGRLGSNTKIKLTTWGNPDPYIAIDSKAAEDFVAYETQYGLQSLIYSKVYSFLIKATSNVFNVTDLRYLITFIFVLTNLFIFILIYKKVDVVYANIWLFTLFTSPWVMLFSRNIYWSIFSFYLPILISIFYSISKDYKQKTVILVLVNFSLIFRFLMGYEFFTTLILTCLYFCFLPLILNGNFLLKNIWKELTLILSSFFGSLITAIGIHGFLSPDGISSNFARMLTRSSARSASGTMPISTIVSTIESYYLSWPKMFGWPIWYSENNVLVIPIPILENINLTGKDFIILIVLILVLLFINILKKRQIHNFWPLIILIAPMSWLIMYPIHENEHGIDFILMYFGSLQAIFFIIVKKMEKIMKNYFIFRKRFH